MTLHQLSIWIVVAKHQNVTKTADELHIKQPSVSQQIKSLQKECGIKLYKVNTGNLGIELTQAGKLLLKHAKKVLLQVKTFEKKLKTAESEDAGKGDTPRSYSKLGALNGDYLLGFSLIPPELNLPTHA